MRVSKRVTESESGFTKAVIQFAQLHSWHVGLVRESTIIRGGSMNARTLTDPDQQHPLD